MHPHLSADVSEHFVPVVELHAEHRVGKGLGDRALELDRAILLAHLVPFASANREFRPTDPVLPHTTT